MMREWINLERERLAQEIARRKEEKEREERREKSFLEVLTKLQDQVFTFLSKQQNGNPTNSGSCGSGESASTTTGIVSESASSPKQQSPN